MYFSAPSLVYVPEAMQARPTPPHRAQEVLAPHLLARARFVEDTVRRAVGEEDVDGRVVGDGGFLGPRGGRGVEAIFVSLVGEGPVAEFGLVGGRVDLVVP